MRSLASILFASLAVVLSGCGSSSTTTTTPVTAIEWTWKNGSSTVGANSGQPGVYGTVGVPAASNVPGGRSTSVTWTDKSGNLWLFGGQGFDSTGAGGLLNDLWEFSPANKEWTWTGGSSALGTVSCSATDGSFGQSSVYGTLGVPATTNVPGGRSLSVSWTDISGNLWLFGGYGCSGFNASYLNDLWEFSPTANTWTWVSGSSTSIAFGGVPGVYGTLGTPSITNTPGGRVASISWIDSSGNLWLFGGVGFNSDGTQGLFNDLWKFSPTAKIWTWVGGSGTENSVGVYGTLGSPAAGNVPPALSNATAWTDSSGNLWFFGGDGYDSTGAVGDLNNVWKYSPTANTWTWVSGSGTNDAQGVYGAVGVAATSNVPGSRLSSVSWTDSSGNFWFFGGVGYDSTGTLGYLNDLWKFNPSAKTWTWVSGSDAVSTADGGQPGIYGTLGSTAATNTPGGRDGALGWTDSSGNFWLFGGFGFDSTDTPGDLNDLWSFQP
jgi:N-acetylneuraminic acid mutarotase